MLTRSRLLPIALAASALLLPALPASATEASEADPRLKAEAWTVPVFNLQASVDMTRANALVARLREAEQHVTVTDLGHSTDANGENADQRDQQIGHRRRHQRHK